MVGAMLLEVEGVLANTAPLRRAALHRALADDGVARDPADLASDDHTGHATREIVRRALLDHDLARDEGAITLIAHRADRYFDSLMHAGVSRAPGAREMLAASATRCRLALVTGLGRATVDSLLALAELEGAFEVIVAAENVAAAKPAPDAHRKAFERLRRRRTLDLLAAVALEPGAVGARAAHAAGIRCVVVGTAGDRRIADADAMIPSLAGYTPASLDALLSLRAAG